MAVRTTPKKKNTVKQSAEDFVTKQIVDTEYQTGLINVKNRVYDLESAVDMLECERTEKNADWMSDIFIPEFPAQMLTQSSIEANQYFTTRDYVGVYLEDGSPEAVKKADANKELINRTLNQRYLRHYQKFMRANIIKNISGEVFMKCGWERKTAIKRVPQARLIESDVDEYGNAIVDRSIQTPAMMQIVEKVPTEVTAVDRFNYEIVDRRNIFMDNSYVYSLQDKQWIIIREEKKLSELKSEASFEGYINLEKLEDKWRDIETESSKETYNKDDKEQKVNVPYDVPLDVIHRYGKFWAIVNQSDDNGNPVDIAIGIDDNGKPLQNAELVECIISFAISGGFKQLIRFLPLPFVDAIGQQYRPIIRGICYIHPTKDYGLGDGKFARELQIGINDTFNISNDRVMLATLPTMKAKKYGLEDNTSVYFEPNHVIHLENPDDLVEFKISDNIQGALQQIGTLRQAMSGVTSIFPPALGSVPELAATTATAAAGAEQNKSMRSNYRSLTFEHTFLNELYWMITQMTWQYAEEETAFKLMGEKVYDFDPTAEYVYKPLSQSIESEYSKANHIRELSQLIGFVAPMSAVNPKAATLVNFMLAKIFRYYGDENEDFAKLLLDENAPVTAGQMPANAGMPVQNQTGLPQTMAEQTSRSMMS